MYNSYILQKEDTKVTNISDMENALYEAKLHYYKMYARDRMVNNLDPLYTEGLGIHKEPFIQFMNNVKLSKNSKARFVMFTVNFKEGTSTIDAINKINKCITKVWVMDYIWCMEWRDYDKGMHCHIRVTLHPKKKVYDCKREVYNTFKHLVGNPKHVNYKKSNIETAFIEYVKGMRKGEWKESHELDVSMRKKYNLKDWYKK